MLCFLVDTRHPIIFLRIISNEMFLVTHSLVLLLVFVLVGTLEGRCFDPGQTFVHGSSGGNGGRGGLFWKRKVHNFASFMQVTVSLNDGLHFFGLGMLLLFPLSLFPSTCLFEVVCRAWWS